jgi:hypothetical protein
MDGYINLNQKKQTEKRWARMARAGMRREKDRAPPGSEGGCAASDHESGRHRQGVELEARAAT